ncbi:MAG: hypothetical protein BMS9Abin05_0443 [Rhodothermia bacterium]|nr:MAG: hypothetical protein BMS9Abin05_0443 [Rhodothermia bacterium]
MVGSAVVLSDRCLRRPGVRIMAVTSYALNVVYERFTHNYQVTRIPLQLFVTQNM